MSEQETVETATEATQEQQESSAEPDTEPKPAETVEFWKKKAREQEKRAKENASAATELATLKQAHMSAEEKTAQERADAIAERDAAKAEALRWRIAARHGISDEDAELFLTGTDEDTLTRQAERFQELAPKLGKGTIVPGVGNKPSTPPSIAEQISAAQQAGDKHLVMSLKAQQLADVARNNK